MKEKRIRKLLSIIVIIGSCIITIGCTAYQNYFYRVPHHVRLSEYIELKDVEIQYDVDVSQENRLYDMIRGWVIAKGYDISKFDTKVMLYEEGQDEGLLWLTKMENRSDVTTAMDDQTNYDCSGFQALIPQKYIKGKKYKIALIFYVGQNQFLVKTNNEFVIEEKGN